MKYLFSTILILASFTLCLASCNKDFESKLTENTESTNNPIESKIRITIGSAVFTATLNDNAPPHGNGILFISIFFEIKRYSGQRDKRSL